MLIALFLFSTIHASCILRDVLFLHLYALRSVDGQTFGLLCTDFKLFDSFLASSARHCNAFAISFSLPMAGFADQA